MNDQSTETKKKKTAETETCEPVQTVREMAVAASIWRRRSPSGYAYYDFSLSRSWKSMSSGKTGYSKNFFERNQPELEAVIAKACRWITERQSSEPAADAKDTIAT